MLYRQRQGKVEYLVKWAGYGDNDSTWEREEHMDCPKSINQYEMIMKEIELAEKRAKIEMRKRLKLMKRKRIQTNQWTITETHQVPKNEKC